MNNVLFEGVYSATFSIYDENMNVKKKSVEELIDSNLVVESYKKQMHRIGELV